MEAERAEGIQRQGRKRGEKRSSGFGGGDKGRKGEERTIHERTKAER